MWYSSTTSVVSCLPFQKPIIQICAILSAFEYHKFWEPSPQICFFEDIDFLFEELTVDLVRKFLHRCFRDWRDSWLLWLTVVRRLLILISVETALLRYTHLLCFSYLFSDHTWCAFSFFFGFRFQFFIINLKSGGKRTFEEHYFSSHEIYIKFAIFNEKYKSFPDLHIRFMGFLVIYAVKYFKAAFSTHSLDLQSANRNAVPRNELRK